MTMLATVLELFTGDSPQITTSKFKYKINVINNKNELQTSVINGCPVGLGFTMTLGGDMPLV